MKTICSTLLPSPLHQLQTVKMLNELCGWGFDAHTFDFYSYPVNIPPEDVQQRHELSQAVLLNIRLGTFKQTFNEALHLIQAGQLRMSGEMLHTCHAITSVHGEHFVPMGISWETVDFGANHEDISVRDVLATGTKLPVLEILWAIVYNPMLIQQLAEQEIYSLWLGGACCGREAANVPHLKFDSQLKTLEFNLGHPGNSNSASAIPAYIDKEY